MRAMTRQLRKAWSLAALAILCAGSSRVFAQFHAQVVYGEDDRLDLYQVRDPDILKRADSTVALFDAGRVSVDNVRHEARLATESYGKSRRLCPGEPFFDQESGASCSGFLVAPDIMMTAGHCVLNESACASIRFVFGFAIRKEGELPKTVPASEVYSCARLLGRAERQDGPDWALVKLDRPVVGHQPLALNQAGNIANGTSLYVIGHPEGLPAKFAGGKVRSTSPKDYFVATLNTYNGNSGSPVFNARTGLVEGILSRGEDDYVRKGQCYVSRQCPENVCRGEDVTRLSAAVPDAPPPQSRVAALPARLEGIAALAPDFDQARR